jgi:flagellar hook-associated protein 3 FlgL
MNLANTKINDNYIFGGFVTDTIPFTRDANYTATYAGDDSDQTVLVGDNVEVKINATGTDIFNNGTDVFGALENLINALEAGDPTLAYAEAANIAGAIDQVQTVATESAVYYGRLDSAENYLTRYKANIEDLLGETENANLEQAIVELQLQQTAYEASLSTASQIIQRSLVDYLG